MDNVVVFAFKSMIVSGMLVAYYWLMLRTTRSHYYNRFYLLFSIVFSLAVPLLNFSWLDMGKLPDSAATFQETLSGTIAASAPAFLIIVVAISSILLIIFFRRIYHLSFLKRIHPHKRLHDFILIETQLAAAPFSFLNNLYWRTDISMTSEIGQKILRHELTHIRQQHCYDKLLLQFVNCLFWFNPFFWLIQKELGMVHEFIADAEAVKEGDTESFASMLLQSYDKGKFLNPVHLFYHSPVKRRLDMIASVREPSFIYLRKIMVLPVIIFSMIPGAFSINHVHSNLLKKQYLEKIAAEHAAMNDHQVRNNHIK